MGSVIRLEEYTKMVSHPATDVKAEFLCARLIGHGIKLRNVKTATG